jgi:hypothetical protein
MVTNEVAKVIGAAPNGIDISIFLSKKVLERVREIE